LVLASGPLSAGAEGISLYANVAGGVVTKSATLEARTGNPRPRICRVSEHGLINWEGLPNCGYEVMSDIIREAKKHCQAAIIASSGPMKDIAAHRTMALAFEAAGADAVEVDFKWAVDFEDGLPGRVIRALKDCIGIPVIAKLAPFSGDMVEKGRAAERAGADAITAINTVFPAMKINVRKQQPAITTKFGGLSGAPILSVATAAVYQLYKAVDIPILGCGGVVTGEDALQMIMAGAEAIQMCTVAMLEGPDAFTRIGREIDTLLNELGFDSIEGCVGLAHRRSF
jgi:dihydroorotate dehydrogenase (NAD+) catalytic subunit